MIISMSRSMDHRQTLLKEIEKIKTERNQMAVHIEKLRDVVKTMIELRTVEKSVFKENLKHKFHQCIRPYIHQMAEGHQCYSNRHSIRQAANKVANLAISRAINHDLACLLDDSDADSENPSIDFTPNEIKIIHLICQGKSTKEISDKIRLAPSSVSWYRGQIRNKLGIANSKTNLRSYLIKNRKIYSHQLAQSDFTPTG